jgi:hypothetical protein
VLVLADGSPVRVVALIELGEPGDVLDALAEVEPAAAR